MSMHELQNPLAMANFVIKIAKGLGKPVTNLKLQKVLFFLQGYCLSEYEAPLIDGNFSKWRYGPVEEVVYRNFKNNGAIPITSEYKEAFFNDGIIQIKDVKIDFKSESSDFMEELECVTKKLISIEPWRLVEMTHEHVSWKDHKEDIYLHRADDYTEDEIKECFIENKKFILGEYNGQ